MSSTAKCSAQRSFVLPQCSCWEAFLSVAVYRENSKDVKNMAMTRLHHKKSRDYQSSLAACLYDVVLLPDHATQACSILDELVDIGVMVLPSVFSVYLSLSTRESTSRFSASGWREFAPLVGDVLYSRRVSDLSFRDELPMRWKSHLQTSEPQGEM